MLLLYKVLGHYNKFDSMKSLGLCYMEHGLEYFSFYVKKHSTLGCLFWTPPPAGSRWAARGARISETCLLKPTCQGTTGNGGRFWPGDGLTFQLSWKNLLSYSLQTLYDWQMGDSPKMGTKMCGRMCKFKPTIFIFFNHVNLKYLLLYQFKCLIR